MEEHNFSMAGKNKLKPLEILWTGPYGWPGHENRLPSVPEHPGVYLLTVEYKGGYLIYAAGLTRGPIRKRLREHHRKYLRGDYHVLDIARLERGVRRLIWKGWSWDDAKRKDFEKRKAKIYDALQKKFQGLRIFVADLGGKKRLLERVEATIMNTLYHFQPSPFCDIPDKGMQLSKRWRSEKPILAINSCKRKLHGLPTYFEI